MRIDTLLQHDPSDALQKLLSCHSKYEVQETSLNYNDSYRSLLLSEALYKNDYAQTNRLQLHDAMHYFDSLAKRYPDNDDFTILSARSHYMNGVGFYENDSVVEACKEYLKTLEIMEGQFDVVKLTGYKAKFMGLTYNRLVDLFSDQFMAEPAIYCGEKSLFYYYIAPVSKYSLANIIYKIGLHYDMLGDKDNAYLYYSNALKALPDSNNVVYRDILTNYTLLSYYSLDASAEFSINTLNDIILQSSSESERLTKFLCIGCIYYNEKMYDSATIYLKDVFVNHNDEIAKFQSAEYLLNIYQVRGDSLVYNKYSEYLSDNAVSKYDNMMEVSVLSNLFNDYIDNQKHVNNKHEKKTIIVLSLILLAILSTIVVLSKIISIKKLKDTNLKHKKEKSALMTDILKKDTKIFKLKKELGIKHSTTEIRRKELLNEPVCQTVIKSIEELHLSARDNYYKYDKVLSVDIITELHASVIKHSKGFDDILLQRSPKLKSNDLLLCYLLSLGLNEKQIAILRNRTYSAIKKQIYKIERLLKINIPLSKYVIKIM